MAQLWKLSRRNQSYTDVQVVEGLQSRNREMESWFYHAAKRYFDSCFNEIFFDMDRKQEIFQMAFLKLWTEIDNRTICLLDHVIYRRRGDGSIQPMTCSLTTFLISFAKNEYREVRRKIEEESYAEVYDVVGDTLWTEESDEVDALKIRIVDECIKRVSPTCIEILTMFYYKEMSLDEILEQRKEKNSSKNGLKTAKNKCMNTLRGLVATEFEKYNFNI